VGPPTRPHGSEIEEPALGAWGAFRRWPG